MAKPKVFHEVTLKVPEFTKWTVIEVIQEQLLAHENLELEPSEIAAHPGVDEFIIDTVERDIEQYISAIDVWELIDIDALRKLFKTEISALRKQRKAEEAAATRERAAAEKANRAEEERLRKEGRSFVVPLDEAERAENILRAAGVNVKLLP